MIKGRYEIQKQTGNAIMPFRFKKCGSSPEEYANWHKAVEIALIHKGEGEIKYGSEDIHLKKEILILNS